MNALPPKEIEQALCRLKGVEAARVCREGDAISEVHIAAAPGTRPKHIARDVRSYLAAALGIDVDHKKISIALQKADGVRGEGSGATGEGGASIARNGRARLESLTLHVEAAAAEVQVQLLANGRELRGCARGSSAAGDVERVVLAATLEALAPLVRHEVRLSAGELLRLRIGRRAARLVEVIVCRSHEEQRLLGVCWVRQDPYRAVVLAALNAVNRTLCRLAPVHWMEIRVESDAPSDEHQEVS